LEAYSTPPFRNILRAPSRSHQLAEAFTPPLFGDNFPYTATALWHLVSAPAFPSSGSAAGHQYGKLPGGSIFLRCIVTAACRPRGRLYCSSPHLRNTFFCLNYAYPFLSILTPPAHLPHLNPPALVFWYTTLLRPRVRTPLTAQVCPQTFRCPTEGVSPTVLSIFSPLCRNTETKATGERVPCTYPFYALDITSLPELLPLSCVSLNALHFWILNGALLSAFGNVASPSTGSLGGGDGRVFRYRWLLLNKSPKGNVPVGALVKPYWHSSLPGLFFYLKP